MHQTSHHFLKDVFAGIVKQNLAPDLNEWLQEKCTLISQERNASQLNLTFASVPRKTGRHTIKLTDEDKAGLKEIHPQFDISDWTIDRLCRVWILWKVDCADKENYFRKLQNLFMSAEMNELVALYSGLTGFDYANDWQKQCSEGIRSNIGIVLEAIMYNNPYPYKYLSEPAWNQLIMKAFFTDKDVKRIIGLDERANEELAEILVDYASERRAAHRSVNPQLWRLVSKFIDANNFSSVEKAFHSSDENEKKSAALACFNSNYPAAKQLLEKEPELKLAIAENQVTWNLL